MTVWFPSDDNILKKQLVERGRITDKVIIGKKSSEDEHQMKGVSTNTGGPNTWRDASNGGWFSYTVAVNPDKQMELVFDLQQYGRWKPGI